MRVTADLHIHSRYSRATSPRLTPPCLERWARVKGIALVGTGDCTHPAWIAELRGQLEDAEDGLYTLKKSVREVFDAGPALAEGLPNPADTEAPRFVLTGEISTIYSRGAKTRKVHHVVILPGFAAAAAFNEKLAKAGNISSDGRPILGIDSRDLLAMLLDTDERAMLIPAHIWTPWFSVLGAKSGFDCLDECYRDYAPHIHALETGLSSNPPMNWAVESLDRFAIVSNSDAHSPDKLGREATVLEMESSYSSLAAALGCARVNAAGACKKPPGIIETIEFFPQEGKYHYDGHRTCGVVLNPEESAAAEGLCPVCGKPLTYGVMRRVLELAGRPVDEEAPCPRDCQGTNKRPYRSLIPLRELAAELFETGGASKKVSAACAYLVEKAGSEFSLLMDMSLRDIENLKCPGLSGELLALAVRRMRTGEVSITPGYDGEYGIIRAFAPEEKIAAEKKAGLFGELFPNPSNGEKENGKVPPEKLPRDLRRRAGHTNRGEENAAGAKSPTTAFSLTADQEKAAGHEKGHALIIAGPGTGKTALLAARILRLISGGADPASILALTFTVKAAAELRSRIDKTLGAENAQTGADREKITAATFHSFCASVLREHAEEAGLSAAFRVLDEEEQKAVLEDAVRSAAAMPGGGGLSARKAGAYIEERKRFLLLPGAGLPALPRLNALTAETGVPEADPRLETVYAEYRGRLRARDALDFDDLVSGAVRLFAYRADILALYRGRFRYIFVDEYQDVNFSQYALIQLLVPAQAAAGETTQETPQLCVIGDPNQAIYGFRGADARYIGRFLADYPGAAVYHLSKSFRCAAPIISAAGSLVDTRLEGFSGNKTVRLYRCGYPTEKAEAEGIARRVSRLIGGTTFFALDSGVAGACSPEDGGLRSLGQCAILLRASALSGPIEKALKDHGIPFHLIGENPWREELSVYVDALSILTIHASKGLEFDHVFVAGLEEGILPFTLYAENGKTDEADIEEEKRLLYVAMTRAREGLYLSWAKTRIFQGRKLDRGPSRFLSCLENLVPLEREKLPPREKDPQLRLF
ncbi:MAG: UvrD-helicase domain-containing protein [Spirochaetales bacterium]|jgi:uncharacterized protein (TIGR00375 family)|nr:UvrD-helicase domain-containing protein [Spirochaetales bacterium]